MLLLLRGSAQVVVVAFASTLFLEQWFALAWVSVPEFVLVPVAVPNYSCSPSVVPLGHVCVTAVAGAVVTLVDCIVVAAAAR